MLLAVLLQLPGYGQVTSPDHPDVLMIAVDDLNDWTGHLHGHPQAQTPNIDRLVSRGMVFTNAHCAAPACNPSRAALMSGLRPWETGVYLNGQSPAELFSDTVTLNRHFLAHGYDVRGGGKIYHNRRAEGRKDTWTQWRGIPASDGTAPHNLNGLNMAHFDWGPTTQSASDLGDSKLTDWAIDQLKNAPTDRPLFLAVGYVKPHLPWHAPQKYFDRFPLDEVQLPDVNPDDLQDLPEAAIAMAKPTGDHRAVVDNHQWKKAVQGYLATIAFLDDQVGRLLLGLEESPRANQTIVVWWTDHGWHLGEKQHWRKFALWQDATRTSFAITAPGLTRPDTQCGAPIDYMSVFPTLCDLAGLPTPSHVKGPSLLPLLKDPETDWPHLAVCTHGRGNHAVYDQRWHLIRYQDGSSELYDRLSDPNEWHNLAEDPAYQAQVLKLQAGLPDVEAPNRRGRQSGNRKPTPDTKTAPINR